MPERPTLRERIASRLREARQAAGLSQRRYIGRLLATPRPEAAAGEEAPNLYPVTTIYDAYVAGATDTLEYIKVWDKPPAQTTIQAAADGHCKTVQPRMGMVAGGRANNE